MFVFLLLAPITKTKKAHKYHNIYDDAVFWAGLQSDINPGMPPNPLGKLKKGDWWIQSCHCTSLIDI